MNYESFQRFPLLSYDILQGECIILRAGALLYKSFEHVILNTWTVYCDHAYWKAKEIYKQKFNSYRVVGCVDRVSSRVSQDRFLLKKDDFDTKQFSPSNLSSCFDERFDSLTGYFHIAIRLTKSAHSWLDMIVTSSNDNITSSKDTDRTQPKGAGWYEIPNGSSFAHVKTNIKAERALTIEVMSKAPCNQSISGSGATPSCLTVVSSKTGHIGFTSLQVEWKARFSLFCINTTFFVSMPGKYNDFRINTRHTSGKLIQIKVQAIHLNRPTSWQCSEDCSKKNMVPVTTPSGLFDFNKRISHFSGGTYIFFLRDVSLATLNDVDLGRVMHKEQLFQSWKSTADVCSSIHGNLPEFVSQQVLVEFLDLLKMNPAFEYPVFGALYIGLKVTIT